MAKTKKMAPVKSKNFVAVTEGTSIFEKEWTITRRTRKGETPDTTVIGTVKIKSPDVFECTRFSCQFENGLSAMEYAEILSVIDATVFQGSKTTFIQVAESTWSENVALKEAFSGDGYVEDETTEGYYVKEAAPTNWTSIYMMFGMCLGVSFGSSIGNLTAGMLPGIVIGMLLGMAMDKTNKKGRAALKQARLEQNNK